MAKLHATVGDLQRRRIRRIGDLVWRIQQREHFVHVNQRLLDLAVHHAEEIQRHVQLQHQGIDQHQIADGRAPCHHVACGIPENRNQCDRDNHLLAEIEQRQRILRLNRRDAKLFQTLIVAFGLERLIVKILHRFKIKQ